VFYFGPDARTTLLNNLPKTEYVRGQQGAHDRENTAPLPWANPEYLRALNSGKVPDHLKSMTNLRFWMPRKYWLQHEDVDDVCSCCGMPAKINISSVMEAPKGHKAPWGKGADGANQFVPSYMSPYRMKDGETKPVLVHSTNLISVAGELFMGGGERKIESPNSFRGISMIEIDSVLVFCTLTNTGAYAGASANFIPLEGFNEASDVAKRLQDMESQASDVKDLLWKALAHVVSARAGKESLNKDESTMVSGVCNTFKAKAENGFTQFLRDPDGWVVHLKKHALESFREHHGGFTGVHGDRSTGEAIGIGIHFIQGYKINKDEENNA